MKLIPRGFKEFSQNFIQYYLYCVPTEKAGETSGNYLSLSNIWIEIRIAN
jgi:hypothetical protein